jgi:hypothetical protein
MFSAVALMVTAPADVAAGRQHGTTSSASGIIYGRAEIVENNMRAPITARDCHPPPRVRRHDCAFP